ncbi:MAG: energy-converting hydrogenase subunit [Chloroflexota bacterium]|jgi:energy-converting hydrogenase B subunit Q|nr:energy-converting hydrogenase subunit [Chloroflexota bacterium]
MDTRSLLIRADDQPGVLHRITGEIVAAGGNIVTVETREATRGVFSLYLELEKCDVDGLAGRLRGLPFVVECTEPRPFGLIFGARVIVIGGGAQVAAVASGAVQEADRHNIRGERISVDTIPLVGEDNIAEAVRAVARLPRVRALVLAGSLMGGDIADAVTEVQRTGIPVISLSQIGSVVEVCDLVVSDPLQAGVLAVMAVASTARFDLARVRGRRL